MEAIRFTERGSGDEPERLRFALARLQEKKEAVMDAFFSGDIGKEDMQAMKRRYESQAEDFAERLKKAEAKQRNGEGLAQLRENIQAEVAALLHLDTESEVLGKMLVDHLTVYQDRHMELRLHDLPQVFRFAG